MRIGLKNGCIEISEETGSILKLGNGIKNFVPDGSIGRPLFEMRLMDKKGAFSYIDASAARKVCVTETSNREEAGQAAVPATAPRLVSISFDDFAEIPGLGVRAEAAIFPDEDKIEWGIAVSNRTGCYIENLDYPCIAVPSDLGGGTYIFWPKSEGCIIDDIKPMDRMKISGCDNKSLRASQSNMYPGMVLMQFMAYYGDNGGLYYAAHDTGGVPKLVQCYSEQGGICLSFKAFCAIPPESDGGLQYKMVTQLFSGDWMDAAAIYRDFVETSEFDLPEKVHLNKDLPAWHAESPVVVIYPPRSIRGTGYLGPNEYFPYENGIKYMDDLAEDFDSKILAFLTYWEGSAPWAPPFIWPPYGGEEAFNSYVGKMHAKGHYIGVYGSGLHWTDKSLLVPEYDMEKYREENGLTSSMCTAPDGELFPGVCETIRSGYNMCVTCEPTCEIAMDQFGKILSSGVDFVQYFDQNMGGRAYICYNKEHGHPHAFGKWSTEAMKKLYDDMNEIIGRDEEGRSKCALGCECAPADCYIKNLPFNDLRYYYVISHSKFVPAYSFVFHEYSVNFMGNQSGFNKNYIPFDDNPESLVFCMAYSFIAGNLLTVVIKSGGEIHWDWGMSWLIPGPRRKGITTAVRNFNAMRRGCGMKYLHHGRMMKPEPVWEESAVTGTEMAPLEETFALRRSNGTEVRFTPVLYSKWKAPDGTIAQIFANFTPETKKVFLKCQVKRLFDQDHEIPNSVAIEIPPYSSIGAELFK